MSMTPEELETHEKAIAREQERARLLSEPTCGFEVRLKFSTSQRNAMRIAAEMHNAIKEILGTDYSGPWVRVRPAGYPDCTSEAVAANVEQEAKMRMGWVGGVDADGKAVLLDDITGYKPTLDQVGKPVAA
jgi:hypothetical protein